MIATTAVDNSVSSTGDSSNPYVCETTNDKAFLLSYEETTSPKFGLNGNQTPISYVRTDYAKARGAGFSWWLRSPSSLSSNFARYAYPDGSVDIVFVGYSSYGVRPAIRMNLD